MKIGIVTEGSKKKITSRNLARLLGKKHKTILRDIRIMEPDWVAEDGHRFVLVSYPGKNGQERPEYLLTKSESTFIASAYGHRLRARIQKLWEKVEEDKLTGKLLTREEVLFATKLKEVFKYVSHQELVEDTHKAVFAAKSRSQNAYRSFYVWRNQVLGLDPDLINERIKQFCLKNDIALTKKKISKRAKILMLDCYESVKNAVWDYLTITDNAKASILADLAGDMIRVEGGEVFRKNETDLFHQKQDLPQFNNLESKLLAMPVVATAKKTLQRKKELKRERIEKMVSGLPDG